MVEWILARFGSLVGADVAIILAVLFAVNIALTSASKGLEVIMDKTETNLDNKAYAVINSIIKVVVKILDIVGYNPAHKK